MAKWEPPCQRETSISAYFLDSTVVSYNQLKSVCVAKTHDYILQLSSKPLIFNPAARRTAVHHLIKGGMETHRLTVCLVSSCDLNTPVSCFSSGKNTLKLVTSRDLLLLLLLTMNDQLLASNNKEKQNKSFIAIGCCATHNGTSRAWTPVDVSLQGSASSPSFLCCLTVFH